MLQKGNLFEIELQYRTYYGNKQTTSYKLKTMATETLCAINIALLFTNRLPLKHV